MKSVFGSQRHTCHAVGCEIAVPPKMFMCRDHWSRLPCHHQQAIWTNYKRGQETAKNPTLHYLVASHKAILAMATIDGRSPDELARVRKTLEWLEGKIEKYG